MRHLYNSLVQVYYRVPSIQYGGASSSWAMRTDILDEYANPGEMWCRIDVGELRPGRDLINPPEKSSVIPDRFGVLYADYNPYLKNQDILKVIEGPLSGNFQVMGIPDTKQDYRRIHHLEVFVQETSQMPNLVNLTPSTE